MAVGDKLVTLDGLKAVYQDVNGNVNDLKSAFVNDVGQITGNEPLVFQSGVYRTSSSATAGQTVYFEVNEIYMTAISPCSYGDVFSVHVYGSSSSRRAYYICDENMVVLSGGIAPASTEYNGTITVTVADEVKENVRFIVFNNLLNNLPSGYYAYHGTSIVGDLNTNAFKRIGSLTENDNLNDITDSGWYRWTSSHLPINRPQGYASMMLVYSTSSTSVTQIVVTNGASQTMWFRWKTSSGWSDTWTRMTTSSVLDSQINAAIAAIKAESFHAVSFVQGSISDAGTSISKDTRLRTQHIPVASFTEATCGNGGWLNYYCYDRSRKYIDRVTAAMTSVTKDDVVTAFPTASYVRFVFGVEENPTITPSDASTYSLFAYVNPADDYQSTYKAPDLPMIQEQMNNGVLDGTFAYKWLIDPDDTQDYIITMRTKYATSNNSDIPYIRIYGYATGDGSQSYTSPSYEFASSTEFVEQSWRLPNAYCVSGYQINLQIPSGSTLAVESFSISHDMGIRHIRDGITFVAHMGYDALFPSGSYDAIVSAAKLGFQSCVVIPKITADGVPICFHDDSNISGQITQTDGSAIPSEYDIPIQQLTYDQLMQWSIGYKKNPVFAGAKILKMDDFLYICAKTGMKPVFSVHPQQSEENWQILKELLDKYGLTKYLSVKSGNYIETWTRVINVFGDGNIDRIICLYATDASYDLINRIETGKSAAGITKTRVDAEFFLEALEAGTSLATTQLTQLQAAIAAGYKCSCVLEANTHSNVIRKYVDMGVTEFTNGRHCSIGLNW